MHAVQLLRARVWQGGEQLWLIQEIQDEIEKSKI